MRVDYRKATVALVAVYIVAIAVFALWPNLDLAVSGLFYRKGDGFPLAGRPDLQALREAIWALSIGMVLLSLGGVIAALVHRPIPGFGAPLAAFVLLLYFLGPGLLVNGILKQHWGRARPADIVPFGGEADFTAFWAPADQCVSNCSFVSGEGSAAAALLLSLVMLASPLRQVVPQLVYRAFLALAIVLPAIGIGLRVATGRHFLSDTVFAVLFVLTIALVLHRLLLHPRNPAGVC